MTEPLPVLLVDDQEGVVEALSVLLDLHDIPFRTASSPEEALRVVRGGTVGAVVQDMNFSPEETSGRAGVELFHRLRDIDPELPVFLLTAWASLETAVELVKEGAVDYVEKPWDDAKLVATLQNLLRLRSSQLENRRLRRELTSSRAELAEEHDLRGIVYASRAMHKVVSLAVSVAGSDAPVLITGPSGAGKELLAEIVQANSPRRGKAFVKVNVGALPQELMESELFGAEPGAYTGLRSRRIGHFESADGGTLFLDEIDALPAAGQVKLLRVLQSGEFQRLGSSTMRRVDVRIVSASNASLPRLLEAGEFREDLYFRLNVVELRIPPLSERRDDILPLARHFLARFAAERGEPLSLAGATEEALLLHPWPGNVRELENRIRRASLVASASRLGPADLGLGSEGGEVLAEPDLSDDELRERLELLRVIEEEDGIVARVAERLDLSRQAVYRKMDRLGIEIERRAR